MMCDVCCVLLCAVVFFLKVSAQSRGVLSSRGEPVVPDHTGSMAPRHQPPNRHGASAETGPEPRASRHCADLRWFRPSSGTGRKKSWASSDHRPPVSQARTTKRAAMVDFGQTDFGQLCDRLWPIVDLTDFGQLWA